MKKVAILIQAIFISIVIASLYGILHDQVTYSISPEYFTKFKYEQFGLEPGWFGGNRLTVAVVGFWATWWVGLFIGTGLGITALILPDHKTMFTVFKKALQIVLLVTVVAGLTGFLYGRLYLVYTNTDWWLPENVTDKNAFITTGTIHNFSYIGGSLGLMAGMIYIILKKFRLKFPAIASSAH